MILVRVVAIGVGSTLLFTSAAAAQPVTKFDLTCSGVATDRKGGRALSERQFTKRLRVDLDGGMWCEDACTEATRIAGVTPSKLSLTDYQSRLVRHTISINRQTGGYHELDEGTASGQYTVHEGSCMTAPFSGFPASKF